MYTEKHQTLNNLIRSLTHTSDEFKSVALRALQNCLLLSPLTQKYFSQDHSDSLNFSSSFSSSTSPSSIPIVILSLLSFRIGPPEQHLADQVHSHTSYLTPHFSKPAPNSSLITPYTSPHHAHPQCTPYWGIGSNEQLNAAAACLKFLCCCSDVARAMVTAGTPIQRCIL
jgi:hypothetical protein